MNINNMFNNKINNVFKKSVIVVVYFALLLTSFVGNTYAEELDLENMDTDQNIMQSTDVTNMTETTTEDFVVSAEVISVGDVYEKEEVGFVQKIQQIEVKILEGLFEDQVVETEYMVSYDLDGKIENYELSEGNNIELRITVDGSKIVGTAVQNVERANYIYLMVIIFFALILIVGRKQGLKAIIAFIVTILAIFLILLPGIIDGKDAVFMTIMTAIGIIIITFVIIAGFNKKSLTAMLGTSGGVISAGIFAGIFGFLAKLSGASEEAVYLSANTQNLVFNFRDLLFAGIVISSLGAAMDVGMSIASALEEIKQKNKEISKMELFKSGMSIGGDIIGTMTNTLILAYIGGAINLVLLYMVNETSVTDILNIELIATDAIAAIAASMGVIFTVPITALVYSLIHSVEKVYDTKPKSNIEGRRSIKF